MLLHRLKQLLLLDFLMNSNELAEAILLLVKRAAVILLEAKSVHFVTLLMDLFHLRRVLVRFFAFHFALLAGLEVVFNSVASERADGGAGAVS